VELGSALAALQACTGILQDQIISPLSHQEQMMIDASEFKHKKEAESTVCPT